MTDTPDIEMFIEAKDRVRELYELIYEALAYYTLLSKSERGFTYKEELVFKGINDVLFEACKLPFEEYIYNLKSFLSVIKEEF